MKQKIEEALAGLQSSLGGGDVSLTSIDDGVVTVRYRKPLSNPAACHVDRGKITPDIVLETVRDSLKQAVPGVRDVVIVEG